MNKIMRNAKIYDIVRNSKKCIKMDLRIHIIAIIKPPVATAMSGCNMVAWHKLFTQPSLIKKVEINIE